MSVEDQNTETEGCAEAKEGDLQCVLRRTDCSQGNWFGDEETGIRLGEWCGGEAVGHTGCCSSASGRHYGVPVEDSLPSDVAAAAPMAGGMKPKSETHNISSSLAAIPTLP
ncbi:hypothetical protein CSIM01_13730 [Colletotrichum simmondsii]|uniref:Uncharacterized protein n=1 Tax=Colletotrichum simmondsii TaxID=703756 RepID=A0A135S434_9PEZI|nr:hypothetical protein CSIM01_13730 [Colletotrichum simmondsii]